MPSAAPSEVATVYANALFELARSAGGDAGASDMGEEVASLCEIVRADARMRRFIESPVIGAEKRGKAIERMLKGRVSDRLLTFLLVLNRKGRLGALLAVGDAYDAALQQAFGKAEVDVYTVDGAAPSPESQQAMRERIRAATGKDPVFHFYADPHMVGGVKFRIGDQLVDGSVATRLRRMRSALIEKGGARVRAASKDFLG